MANSILDLLLRIKKQGTGAKDADKELSGLQGRMSALKNVAGVLAGSAALGAVVAGLKFAISAAMDAERVMAQTESTIKATGSAAGLTAGQVSTMALSLSRMTGIEDEAVQEGQNLLLTFKEIKGEAQFERATEAMLDMSVAMNKGNLEGLDLKSTAIQVGKALNVAAGDTTAASTALSALTRVGVAFTSEQKKAALEAVKLGNVLEFQNVILSELESEFGGAAKAAGETTVGAFAKLRNEAGNLAEVIGGVLLPAMEENAGGLTKWLRGFTVLLDAMLKGRISVLQWQGTLGGLSLGMISAQQEVERLAGEVEWETQKAAEAELAQRALSDRWDEGKRAALQAAAAAGDYGDALEGSKEALEKNFEPSGRYASITGEIAAAQERINAANARAAGPAAEVNAALQDAGIKGTIYLEALRGIDQVLQTSLATDELKQQAVKGIVDEYKRTGDIDAFKASLRELYMTDLPETQKGFDASRAMAQAYLDTLNNIPDQVTTHVSVFYNQMASTEPGPAAPLPPGGPEAPPVGGMFQHGTGGWWTVPPGFPNDSFRAGLSSGERVNVIPAGASQSISNTFQNSFSINGGGNTEMIARRVAEILGAQADVRRRTG